MDILVIHFLDLFLLKEKKIFSVTIQGLMLISLLMWLKTPDLTIFGEDDNMSTEATNEISEDIRKNCKVKWIYKYIKMEAYQKFLKFDQLFCHKWGTDTCNTKNLFTSLVSQNHPKWP